MNPNDVVRRQILQYFYDRNAAATSARGKCGSAMKISDVKRGLKARHGLSQQNVVSNLTYLIDRGWVKKEEVQKTIVVKGGTIPSTATWYEISAKGIDKIEGGSEFEPRAPYQGINITATGTNVLTLGDGNVVNAQFSSLRERLDNFKECLTDSFLTERQKLEVVSDIESLKDQLAKEKPDKTVIARLWDGVERVAALAGLVDAAHRIWPLMRPLV